MTHATIELSGHDMVALGREALAALRAAVLRADEAEGPAALQEAGYAGSDGLARAFSRWAVARGESDPGELSLEEFTALASAFFRDAGWGTLRLDALRDAVATVDSDDWAESDAAQALDHPGCHFTTGMLAGFFAHVADQPLAVLEVECRSMGAPRCRFLLGSGEMLAHVFDAMENGTGYEEAVGSAG